MKNKRAQPYDRVLKENLETAVLPIIQRAIGIRIKKSEVLPEQQNVTIRREVDYLRKVYTEKGEELILHIEFQSTNDPEMIYRLSEYHSLIQRKYPNLIIRHFVIYIGNSSPNMKIRLPQDQVFKGYELINIHDLKLSNFLASDIPEEIVLAILADFPVEQASTIVRLILRRLKDVCDNENELQVYIEQLNLLSQARKLDQVTLQTIKAMPITIDITENALYKEAIKKGLEKGFQQGIEQGLEKGLEQGLVEGIERGIEQGIEQGIERGVELMEEKMLKEKQSAIQKMLVKNFDITDIVSIMNVSEELVVSIQETMLEEEE
ncbi:MAG: hypothetical protein MI974_33500 [Chitinophagales bacterium]|nr:hypothetical protein [Chitinophagales bacterium]